MNLPKNSVHVAYSGHDVEVEQGKSLLETLETKGFTVPSSCRAGVCQSCLMQATEGAPPAAAQKGLKPSLQEQGYFLACRCYPERPFGCTLGDDAIAPLKTRVLASRLLSPDVVLVRLGFNGEWGFRGGQFVNLHRPDGLVRSYSIASLPEDGPHIDIHVRRAPQGRMSAWIHDELAVGQEVEIRGPHGDCFYGADAPDETLLLAGTGTGIAPLYAVLRAALQAGHKGAIHFFQGGRSRDRLYFVDELAMLAEAHPNIRYTQVLLEGGANGDGPVKNGKLDESVLAGIGAYKNGRAYVCGDAEIVHLLRKKLFLAGMSMRRIHSDAFVSARP